MEPLNPTDITVRGSRPGVGVSATTLLLASSLNGRASHAGTVTVFGDAPFVVHDMSGANPGHITSTVITVTGDTTADLQAVRANRANVKGLIVITRWDRLNPQPGVMSPADFATKAGVTLVGFVPYDNGIAQAHRDGFLSLGYHSAADLRLDPAFAATGAVA